MSGRCLSCNNILTEIEMRTKDDNGDYIYICNRCNHKTYLAEHDYYAEDNNIDHILFGYGKQESYHE